MLSGLDVFVRIALACAIVFVWALLVLIHTPGLRYYTRWTVTVHMFLTGCSRGKTKREQKP